MLDYISVRQATDKCGNRISGAVCSRHAWAIPKDAEKPADKRKTRRTSDEK